MAQLADSQPDSPVAAPSKRDDGVLNVARLSVGQILLHGLYDEDGVLLLAGGTVVSDEFLRLLRRRRIRYVQSRETPPAIKSYDVDEAAIAQLEAELVRPDLARINTRPLDPRSRPRMPLEEMQRRAEKGRERHAAATSDMASFCQALETGEKVSDRELHRIARDFAEMASADLDLLPTILSLRTSPDEYLYQHCINGAALSMVIATQLGLRRERVLEVGLGAMLHDVGMLRVPLSIRQAPRELTPPEIEAVRRHPAYTVEYLSAIAGLPRDVRFLGFQIHERIDHSGYPRGRGPQEIHAYAKIVAVADAYVAMTSPRPYRPAMTPYEAVKTILYDCGGGRFDSAVVRALLDCISLFPTGSRIELDDGRAAQVIRATPDRHTRPVIRIVRPDGTATGELIDLSQATEYKVTRTLASAPAA